MLKKCCAIAMLLLMIVSFTIGSVDVVGVSSNKHDNAKMYWKELPNGMLPPLPMLYSGAVPYSGEHADDRFTSVILDFSGQEAPREGGFSWHAPGLMPPFRGVHMVPGNDYINGRIIVHQAGSDAPRTFQVKFFRHQVPMETGAMVSYRANTTIAMSDDNSSFFTFNGEIVVTGDSTRYNNAAIVPDDGYNEITMGQTAWHQAQVSGVSTEFNFDLQWDNPNDSLRLVVYTPDGHVLGPYTDVSDGKADGRINMEVDNPDGVADGAWLFKVTGTSVTGKDEYYIRTW